MAVFRVHYPIRALLGIEHAPSRIPVDVQPGSEVTLNDALRMLSERYPEFLEFTRPPEPKSPLRTAMLVVDGKVVSRKDHDSTRVESDSTIMFFVPYQGG
ncbi:ThiS family [Slackia heliotrinireducens]|uniref:MoaD/ThiS family protein n=1 Tax=Slackia heliotrinireducens (strain ATCC 29202 / DSM 20476 / NCTC 11029 / RHS 1) TaxID=471855 RepID=C7N2Y5_SLAHD|nr:MoaD/ThiS family protein [Slackia heliotrinireducens]ACV21506.1 hypothetical protein Shel_04460 [Slackia heliotrinireducens DSM 20476]VEG98958.1 ThiS family [Slackia heliotrinireducens]